MRAPRSAQIAVAPAPATTPAAAPEPEGTEVKSPMIGTFYRKPSPDAEAFVEVGAKVNPDTVVCIIEAMKLMNDIKSEHAGEVVEIFVENGQPVQYGERLFAIRRA